MGALQTFLENGFDAFGAMRGAREFLATIQSRETALAARLWERLQQCLVTLPSPPVARPWHLQLATHSVTPVP